MKNAALNGATLGIRVPQMNATKPQVISPALPQTNPQMAVAVRKDALAVHAASDFGQARTPGDQAQYSRVAFLSWRGFGSVLMLIVGAAFAFGFGFGLGLKVYSAVASALAVAALGLMVYQIARKT